MAAGCFGIRIVKLQFHWWIDSRLHPLADMRNEAIAVVVGCFNTVDNGGVVDVQQLTDLRQRHGWEVEVEVVAQDVPDLWQRSGAVL